MEKSILDGYRITTAKIIYHRPDHIHLLQEFIWQDLDLSPRYPELQKFLDFWQSNLDGPLHSVEVMSAKVIKPDHYVIANADFTFH